MRRRNSIPAKQYVIWAYKLHGCGDCGRKPCEAGGDLPLSDLHCHHRDPASKNTGYRGFDAHGPGSIADTLTELAKCDVLCRHCHAAHHRHPSQRQFKLSTYEFASFSSFEQPALIDD